MENLHACKLDESGPFSIPSTDACSLASTVACTLHLSEYEHLVDTQHNAQTRTPYVLCECLSQCFRGINENRTYTIPLVMLTSLQKRPVSNFLTYVHGATTRTVDHFNGRERQPFSRSVARDPQHSNHINSNQILHKCYQGSQQL